MAVGDNEPQDREQVIDVGMNSCAAEFVIPPGLVNAPVRPSEGSRDDLFYRRTSGDSIFNEGEQRVQFLNERGKLMAMTLQVAKVTRPLASLLKMTKAGNRIILDSEGSYVLHKESRIKTPICEKKRSLARQTQRKSGQCGRETFGPRK